MNKQEAIETIKNIGTLNIYDNVTGVERGGVMKRLSPYILSVRRGPDWLMWRETDYHKQKELEKKNPIFKRGDRK